MQSSPTKNTMTKLDAINLILSGIGETLIEEIEDPVPSDIALMLTTLDTATREVQLTSWHFNTERDYELFPDTFGYIRIPNDVHRLTSHDPRCKYILRGGKVYDEELGTYCIDRPIRVDITRILPFEDMPLSFRNYVAIRAARKYQNSALGSSEIKKWQEQDEMEAKLVCLKEEQAVSKPNVMKGSPAFLGGWSVRKTLHR